MPDSRSDYVEAALGAGVGGGAARQLERDFSVLHDRAVVTFAVAAADA